MSKIITPAEIEEMVKLEYWKKLRGDVFLALLSRGGVIDDMLSDTELILNALYKQHNDFVDVWGRIAERDKNNDKLCV